MSSSEAEVNRPFPAPHLSQPGTSSPIFPPSLQASSSTTNNDIREHSLTSPRRNVMTSREPRPNPLDSPLSGLANQVRITTTIRTQPVTSTANSPQPPTNNNNGEFPQPGQNLFHMRDRLFLALFFRVSLIYARAFPKTLRRFIEFCLLMQSIILLFILGYIHVVYTQTPITCLSEHRNSWPKDGETVGLPNITIMHSSTHALLNVSNYLNAASSLMHTFASTYAEQGEQGVEDFQFSLFGLTSEIDVGSTNLESVEICSSIPYKHVIWDDIVGQKPAKNILQEAMVWPTIYPSAFGTSEGQRRPWTGILLYGPPGTAKTQLACAAANECGAYFITMSISEIMCKYMGESEKMIKKLFKLANEKQSSIIFVDEVDSIMAKRSELSSEDNLRVKATLLVEMTEVCQNQKVFIIGATNMPELLDSAFLRRFEVKEYTQLPTAKEREDIFKLTMKKFTHALTEKNFQKLVLLSIRFSGADIKKVVKDANYIPVRRIAEERIQQGHFSFDTPITMKDMESSLAKFEPTVTTADLRKFERIARKFGSRALTFEDI